MSENGNDRLAFHGVDQTVAHNARVWNYWLGGGDNFPADREVGDRISHMFPNIMQVARADRAFLGRVVRFLAGPAGIRQFLDIGTGLPTHGNTHEVAQEMAAESRIVYADNDPLVLLHARGLLTSTPEGATDYVHADLREPNKIIKIATKTLDFDRPVAIMLLGVLNFVLDTKEAQSIVRELLAVVPSGSHLVITHPTLELGGEANVEAMAFWNQHAKPPIRARTGAEIAAFFNGLDLLEPGLVSCTRWRAPFTDIDGNPPAEVAQYGAVGRKR